MRKKYNSFEIYKNMRKKMSALFVCIAHAWTIAWHGHLHKHPTKYFNHGKSHPFWKFQTYLFSADNTSM